MARSRNQGSTWRPHKTLKEHTKSKARAHERMGLNKIIKGVADPDAIVLYSWKEYDDIWNYD